MQPADDSGAKGGVYRTMSRNPCHRRKGRRTDDNFPMAFPRPVIATVTTVFMAFVDHLQGRGLKYPLQTGFYLLRKSHYFILCPCSLPPHGLSCCVRVGKGIP